MDLLILQAIKIVDNSAYLNIYNNKESLLFVNKNFDGEKKKAYIDSDKNNNEYCAAVESITVNIKENERTNVREAIDYLFRDGTFNVQELLDKMSIRSDVFFDTYFMLDVPVARVSCSEIEKVKSFVLYKDFEKLVPEINKLAYVYSLREIRRCFITIVSREKSYNSRSELSKTLSLAISKSKLTDNYSYNSNNLSCIARDIVIELINSYMYVCNERDETNPIFDYPGVSDLLSELYSFADLKYCLCLNVGVVKHLDNDCMSSKYVKNLIERFAKESYTEQMRYSKLMLSCLFTSWKLYNSDGLQQWLKDAICNDGFDCNAFVNKMIDRNSAENDISNFVSLFEDVMEMFMEKLKVDDIISDNSIINKLKFNYKNIIRNNRERRRGENSPSN